MNPSADQELTATARIALGVVVAISAAVCVYAIRQADPDLFGYLAYGRFFLQHGLNAPDPFAYTSTGFHWVAFEYLAQVVFWTIYSEFGPIGLIGLKCIVGGLAIYFLWLALRATTTKPIVLIPIFLLATSTVSRFFVFRPQLFTFMFFALFIAILFRFLVRGSASLWVLPLVMLVWANAHGGFLAGLAAICLAIALRVSRNLLEPEVKGTPALQATTPLWLTLAACLAITAINPQGVRLWQYVSTEILHDTNRTYIAEWQPLGWDRDPWSAAAVAFMTAVLLIVGFTAQLSNKRVAGSPPWLWIVSAAPAIGLATLSVRHVPLAALWSAPVITLLAASIWNSPRASAFGPVWAIVSGCTLVPIVITLNYVIASPQPVIATDGKLLGEMHPCTAVAFMKETRLKGNLYLPLWWGSFVTWEMYPDIRVSMDGRNISLFPAEMVAENLRLYSNDVTRDDLKAPGRYDSDFLLVPAHRPVLEMVRGDREWREVFRDSQSSIFVRNGPAHEGVRSTVGLEEGTRRIARCPRVLP